MAMRLAHRKDPNHHLPHICKARGIISAERKKIKICEGLVMGRVCPRGDDRACGAPPEGGGMSLLRQEAVRGGGSADRIPGAGSSHHTVSLQPSDNDVALLDFQLPSFLCHLTN